MQHAGFGKTAMVILVFLLVSAACMQPAAQPAVVSPSAETPPVTTPPEERVIVTADRYESTKIRITYLGGPDADQLIELQTTVISKIGSVNIQSMGSRIDTTPVRVGGTDVFQGPYADRAHVLSTAYYVNGTHRDILDTWI